MMRAPNPSSEPMSNTFPTYQVPQRESAMRGSAPHDDNPVQQATNHHRRVARATWGGRADPLTSPPDVTSSSAVGADVAEDVALSVITGSSCRPLLPEEDGNSNLKMQSVTDNCLLNSVTVPKIQRNGRYTAAHNNLTNINNYDNNKVDSDKLGDSSSKFGALPLGRDIPYQKSDDLLEVIDGSDNLFNINALRFLKVIRQQQQAAYCDNNNDHHHPYDKDESHCLVYDDLCHVKQMLRTPTEHDQNDTEYAPLRLRGGGESSLSTGTSGWGSPPSNQASNNNANNTAGWGTAPPNQSNAGTQQWNNANRPPASNQGQDANKPNANGQQPPTTQSNNASWGQPGANANKPPAGVVNPGANLPPATATSGANATANTAAQNNNNTNAPNNSTTAQLEQLKNMREAIFSQDGWGGQHVNQDTNWDIPSSPEPPIKLDGTGPPAWKPPVNNGTELWEANLRNGGQPPPQPQQKTPWGHTPSTNIGGTWGEDDDAADSSNVWTGVPNNQQQWGNNVNNGMGWGGVGGGGGNGNNGAGTLGGGGGAGGAPNNSAAQGGWGDPRAADPRMAAAAAAVGGMDNMRPDVRVGGMGGMDPRQMDPRQMGGAGDMRVDLRGGITGRLNGAGVEFWGQSGPLGGPGGMPPNKMPGMGPGNGPAWDEPSPPSQRRGLPNYDDGTSLWGNPQPGAGGGGLGMGGARGAGGGPNGPPGMAPNRGGLGPKPDGGGVWGGGGRNGWGDDIGGGSATTPGWEDPNAGGPWPKQKMGGGPGGGLWDNELDWGHKPNIRPQLTKEMVWNSKQFKVLVDMGYKKEDVENALRLRDMNMEEALDILSTMRNRNEPNWGRHDDHFDHSQFQGMGGRGGFPNVGGPINPLSNAFPPNNTPNLLNNMGGNGGQGNNSLINNISPAVMQKMLSQQGGAGGLGSQAFGGAPTGGNGRPLQPPSQPSTQQLRMLVQQIQMAVRAGYLNHQILNQPLAPHTLVLLNQLLQQIKNLQQLTNQQQLAAAASSKGGGNLTSNALMQYSVAITKTKQQILNIQNQITAQQALYVKQQQGGGGGGGMGYDSFKSNPMHDSINALEGNFANIGLKEPQVNQQQSRLNQWINKDKEENNEFSRAPGSSSKPTPTSPNMPLGLTQPDGPWSSGRTDSGWPDSSGGGDSSNDKDAQWATPTQPSLTDLVPEFEPGKPWKGNQIKIEDDPSITPGSVVRSPLSIATIKQDNELFSGMNTSKSPPSAVGADPMASLSLSSSTWSFNPPSTSSAFTSSQVKLPNIKGGLDTAVSSTELWAPKSRGPPPGLSKGGSASSLVNGWSNNLGGGGGGGGSAPWGGSVSGNANNQRSSGNWGAGGGNGQSQWLLLRNLTAQIDGSTLRTLCMQHGPLQSFHLHLHQGFALAKYSSPGEATKAQATLNNCVLGNTTILAENPTDWDAQTLLKSIASQQGGGSAGWQRSAAAAAAAVSNPSGDTWSTGWPNNPSSLWSNSNLDGNDPARATPSNLNSFLPNDLLGGESM